MHLYKKEQSFIIRMYLVSIMSQCTVSILYQGVEMYVTGSQNVCLRVYGHKKHQTGPLGHLGLVLKPF